jgi:hypothetical protein
MPSPNEILVVGPPALVSAVTKQLKPRSLYRVHHTNAVTIGTFTEREPDLAIIDGEVLGGAAAQTIRELRRYEKQFPIIWIGNSNLPDPALVENITVLRPIPYASRQLGPLVSLLLYLFQNERLLQATSAPLGITEGRAMVGAHISVLVHDKDDLRNLARFWTVANTKDDFLLIAPRAAIRVYEKSFASEGLDLRRLRKERRLTIVEAESIDASMLEKLARRLLASPNKGTKLLRIIGATAGWRRKESTHVQLGEHLLDEIIVRLPAILLCPYNAKSFDGSSLVTQALETHSLAISRNQFLRSSV